MYKTIKNNINKQTKEIKEEFIGGLGDITDILKKIGKFFELALNSLIWSIKFIIWLVRFLIYIIFDVLWFPTLFADLFSGAFKYPKIITETLLILMKRVGNNLVNKFIGPLFKNVFGWDWKLNTTKKDIYKTEEGNIPITVIISTILLPPLGLFMRFGLYEWINILICGCLTMFFYFPGLIFALVRIYA
tara:strand:- start:353 stop:919 length:567 start_codon:yes stop_codon:yes gene_type:complete